MKNQTNISDERLDEMLKSMNSEKSENSDENLRPPVINEYRLEKERLRRQKRTQAIAVSIVVAISTIVTTVCGLILLEIYSPQIDRFMDEFSRSAAYKNIENFMRIYGNGIGIAFVIMLVLLVICYSLGAVLLVKNKDKILKQNL